MSDTLLFSTDEAGIATLTLKRTSALNALNTELFMALDQAIQEITTAAGRGRRRR